MLPVWLAGLQFLAVQQDCVLNHLQVPVSGADKSQLLLPPE